MSALPIALWYTPVPNVAGVGRHLLDVARVGIPGYRVMFAVPEGALAHALRARGAAVVTGAWSVADGPRAAIAALASTVRSLRPALVHSHLAFADLVAAAAVAGACSADGSRVRLVSTEHGIAADSGLYQRNKAMAVLKQKVHGLRLRRTDRVIAVSGSTREQVLRQWGAGAPVTVIRNGVDRLGTGVGTGAGAGTGAADGASEAQQAQRVPGLRVLSLARLAPEKRIDCLLEAFALVVREHPEAVLTVAGEGELRRELEAQTEALGIAAHVDFVGFVQADSALRSHDVVAQLSAWENLSYTLLDAVAYGCGVVATDVGGNREIVQEQCLVSASDREGIAAAIIEQGLRVEARPRLVEAIPTVEQMCALIGREYEKVLRGAS